VATVTPIKAGAGRTAAVTIADAIAAYLAGLDRPETRRTHDQYRATLRRFAAHFGPGTDVAAVGSAALRAWVESTWGQRKPATFNRAIDVLRSAFGYWTAEGWCTEDPSRALRRRRVAPDRSRALSRAEVEALLTREDISLREKTLWRMLYETAARAGEVLALDVGDLDLANRRARVRRKGGAVDVIVWQTGTARLLPRLLRARKSGPLFLTDRRGPVSTTPAGYERLSYRRAAEIFAEATADGHGRHSTLHQLRHSALTHAAEQGASTPLLMALSGHTSTRSLARYARVSAEGLQRWQQERDPARRR
jgi:integrase/recombinase XerC/integrase/recombinase XerD